MLRDTLEHNQKEEKPSTSATTQRSLAASPLSVFGWPQRAAVAEQREKDTSGERERERHKTRGTYISVCASVSLSSFRVFSFVCSLPVCVSCVWPVCFRRPTRVWREQQHTHTHKAKRAFAFPLLPGARRACSVRQ